MDNECKKPSKAFTEALVKLDEQRNYPDLVEKMVNLTSFQSLKTESDLIEELQNNHRNSKTIH